MSPEQVTRKPMDERSDIYSLGCLMYECLAGKPPLIGTTALATLCMHVTCEPVAIRAASERRIPSQLAAIVMKALEKDPLKRFQSANELLEQLLTLFGSDKFPTAKVRAVERKPIEKTFLTQTDMIVVLVATMIMVPIILFFSNVVGTSQPLARVSDPEDRAQVMDVFLTNQRVQAYLSGSGTREKRMTLATPNLQK